MHIELLELGFLVNVVHCSNSKETTFELRRTYNLFPMIETTQLVAKLC